MYRLIVTSLSGEKRGSQQAADRLFQSRQVMHLLVEFTGKDMDRYSAKPFLRLLECYVLNAIGQLEDQQRNALQKMEPKLEQVYAMKGSWLEIVRVQMDFPESLPIQIQTIWEKYLVVAKQQGLSVNPNEFAMGFVDSNFPDI